MRILKILFKKTLNSVWFGIGLMAMIAIYSALGSGRPWLREMGLDSLPFLEGWFDLTDLQVFNTTFFKLLMLLLCLNLMTVTFIRIPFTPPRYGVWCIHTGIITLIIGMAYYYGMKVEGLTRVRVGQTVDYFYDSAERSLYFRIGGLMTFSHPLPSLPRFKEYTETNGKTRRLQHADLQGIEPKFLSLDRSTGKRSEKLVSEMMDLPNPLKFEVMGFWPYAFVQVDFADDPTAPGRPGVVLSDPTLPADTQTWLVADDSSNSTASDEFTEVQARHNDLADEVFYREASHKLHELTIRSGEFTRKIHAVPGQTYKFDEIGYEIEVEAYDPNWTMFGTNQSVQALTLMVKSPEQTYRRMVLEGKEVQTDFKLGEEGAGPMGKRQATPLDMKLRVDYRQNDGYDLLPSRREERFTLVAGKDASLIAVRTSRRGATTIQVFPDGKGQIQVPRAAAAPFGPAEVPRMSLGVERKNHIARHERVMPVPENQRDKNAIASGDFQVMKVRATSGEWSKDLFVPYRPYAADDTNWQSEELIVPGSNVPIKLQLSQTKLGMPARVTLKEFELVPYAGGQKNISSVMRDFRSHLTVENPIDGSVLEGVAHMNNPVYYPPGLMGKGWLFFQAQWDPNGQQWSVLGVGNRPGVWVMTAGCTFMIIGLLYAFYAKPMILRKMKENALRAHAAKTGKPEAQIV